MTPSEIQKQLKDHNLSQRDIAQTVGVSDTSVCKVIKRMDISDRIMRAIAEAINEDVRLVFPEYYLRPPKSKASKVLQSSL